MLDIKGKAKALTIIIDLCVRYIGYNAKEINI